MIQYLHSLVLRYRPECPFQEPSHWTHQYRDDMVRFEVTPELVRILEMVGSVETKIVDHLLLVMETLSVSVGLQVALLTSPAPHVLLTSLAQ